jgi:hypothetical protein
MPIDYTFTDRGTIQIECGDEWIEVRLPGAGSGAKGQSPKTAPAPVPDGRGDPVVMPRDPKQADEPEPPVGPGVMSIVTGLGTPDVAQDLFSLDLPENERVDLSQFKVGVDVQMQLLRERIARATGLMGRSKVLDVYVGHLSKDSTVALAQLHKLLREPDAGFNALRLWHDDTPG